MSLGRFGGADPILHPVSGGAGTAAMGELMHAAREHLRLSPEGDLGVTQNLATQAATQARQVVGTTANPSTTSSSNVDLAEMTLTFTPSVATDVLLLVWCTFVHTIDNGFLQYDVLVDGSSEVGGGSSFSIAGASGQGLLLFSKIKNLSAASHTVKVQFSTGSGGTVTADGTRRHLQIVELKR